MWEARHDVGSDMRGATCDAGNEARRVVREMRRDVRGTVCDAGSEVGHGK